MRLDGGILVSCIGFGFEGDIYLVGIWFLSCVCLGFMVSPSFSPAWGAEEAEKDRFKMQAEKIPDNMPIINPKIPSNINSDKASHIKQEIILEIAVLLALLLKKVKNILPIKD